MEYILFTRKNLVSYETFLNMNEDTYLITITIKVNSAM